MTWIKEINRNKIILIIRTKHNQIISVLKLQLVDSSVYVGKDRTNLLYSECSKWSGMFTISLIYAFQNNHDNNSLGKCLKN